MTRQGEALAGEALAAAETWKGRRGPGRGGKRKPSAETKGASVWGCNCCAQPGEPHGRSIFSCPKECVCHGPR